MNDLEKKMPDDFWRNAFEEAAETPPPRVWDAIERRLDESEGPKILPLWGSGPALSRPVGWGLGVAAALALLLVGWWVVNTYTTTTPMAQVQQANQTGDVALNPVAPVSSSAHATPGQSAKAVTSASKHTPSATFPQSPVAISAQQSPARSDDSQADELVVQQASKPVSKGQRLTPQAIVATNLRPSSVFSVAGKSTNSLLPGSPVGQLAMASYLADRSPATVLMASRTVLIERLNGRPLHFRTLGPIQRIVWYQPTSQPLKPETSKSHHKASQMWASVSMMPGAFNPMVSVRSSQSAYATANTLSSSSNQSTVSSRANFSVAYQAVAGVQLTERWSVESGVGYLAGHSTVETPAQSAALSFAGTSTDKNVSTSNLYVDALRSSMTTRNANNASTITSDNLIANNAYSSQKSYNAQAQQVLTNNYQYVQVPVQVGYQLRPRKRLSMAVLGGLLTNIFVKNTVANDVVVTAKDGVYRPVSLAAVLGARFRYRPSGHWSASLAGLYEPSLGLGTQPDSQVQSRPTSTGMSFGVDYHF